jgi:CarboxypepD_reg-like domain/TonB-dependent Receptor Plug Domain
MKTITRHVFLLFTLFTFQTNAQITQILRGTIIDKTAETPLVGAAIVVDKISPPLGAVSDENGNFEIKNVPTGRHQIIVSFIGYNAQTLPNIVVNAGKETVLDIKLEESVQMLNAVTISGKVEKSQTLNELATISARQFNVEEVQRYSGGRNDVSRLAANFAGVAISNDSRNDIVIRGNSPIGVLWRLEGVPIPSPNHFSTLGTTGGPVSALNPNMIRNSDFLTSAFPAEYGNANAGVFDIGFRNGNKDKMEFTAQLAAFSGLEAMIEGPLSKKTNGSYVVAFRQSFVELAQKAGLSIGTTALPRYKDLTFNIDLGQTKLGKFSLFGIGGTSDIDFIGEKLDANDFFANKNEDSHADSKLGIIGLRHNIILDNNTFVRTVISATHAGNNYYINRDKDGVIKKHIFDIQDWTTDYRVSSFINKKFDKKWSMRSGVLVQSLGLNTNSKTREFSPDWVQLRKFDGRFMLYEVYAQTQYKPSEKLTFNAGIHTQFLDYNDSYSVEPRLALNWHLAPNQTVNIGYGLHAQMQPLPVFFYEEKQVDGSYVKTNKDLDFTKSNHFVVGYDVKAGSNWHGKLEIYTQILRGVPVQKTASTFSMLNTGADFGFPETGSLVNKGTGNNIGAEMTLEKFFSDGWYMLSTTSLFDSKYKGSDGIERNTAFNSNYIVNILLGKEFKFGKTKQNAFTLDTKLTTAGGRYFTPVNVAASQAAKREILDYSKAFSEQQTPYFRWDVKVGYTLNSKKRHFTQQFFLDFQNVTNHKNVFQQRYSIEKGETYKVYQMGFFPDVLWRVQF